jgi:hypothetical protein
MARVLRWMLAAMFGLASTQAIAVFQCTDAWGNRYTMDRDPGAAGTFSCVPVEPAVTIVLLIANPLAAPEPAGSSGVAASVSGESVNLGVRMQRGAGLLVLAPPVRSGSMRPSLQESTADPGPSRKTAFDALIGMVASAYGQDADLLRAIVHVESRFDPNAVSPRGAIGLMQIMPSTALELGVSEPRRTLFKPESNLRVGARYLKSLCDQFYGDPALVIAAYNAGPGAVQRSGNAVPPFPETQRYVRDVLNAWQQLREAH